MEKNNSIHGYWLMHNILTHFLTSRIIHIMGILLVQFQFNCINIQSKCIISLKMSKNVCYMNSAYSHENKTLKKSEYFFSERRKCLEAMKVSEDSVNTEQRCERNIVSIPWKNLTRNLNIENNWNFLKPTIFLEKWKMTFIPKRRKSACNIASDMNILRHIIVLWCVATIFLAIKYFILCIFL